MFYEVFANGEKSVIKLGIPLWQNDTLYIYLQKKIRESPYSIKQLAEKGGIDERVLDHFLRGTLWGRVIPTHYLMNLLRPLLSFNDFRDFLDEQDRKKLESGIGISLAFRRVKKYLGRE